MSDRSQLIGSLLRVPYEIVWARLLAGVHERGFTDVTEAHLAVLRWPGPDGRRPSDVAADLGMSKQAINYLLGQLEERGYLTRDAHPADPRARLIGLTARGSTLVAAVRATLADIETQLEAEMGAAKFRRLRMALVELNATGFVAGG